MSWAPRSAYRTLGQCYALASAGEVDGSLFTAKRAVPSASRHAQGDSNVTGGRSAGNESLSVESLNGVFSGFDLLCCLHLAHRTRADRIQEPARLGPQFSCGPEVRHVRVQELCKNEPISARPLTNRRNSQIRAIYPAKRPRFDKQRKAKKSLNHNFKSVASARYRRLVLPSPYRLFCVLPTKVY